MTVLALRALGLGDFLTGVPSYRALKAAYPGQPLVLVAPGVMDPLVRLAGAIDELLPAGELEPIRWDRPPPDVAVDLHGCGPASHRLLDALSPGRRIGFAAPGWAGPAWDEDRHEVSRWCDLLTAAGIPADRTDLYLPRPAPPADGPAGVVVVHPGAAFGSRRWPAGRFAAVARALAADGRPVVITGSAQERDRVTAVAVGADLPPWAARSGAGLGELAALVAHAALVVCGDTGVAHLATAFRTPSVLLFGPMPPAVWGPPDDPRHHVIWHGAGRPGAGRGNSRGDCPDPALLATGVEEVLTAARSLLGPPAR